MTFFRSCRRRLRTLAPCWLTLAAFPMVQQAQTSPYRAVDPISGTANEGQTVPQVGMPFAMTGWVPETQSTEAKCIPPYFYKDKAITGFRASHWLSGSCTQDYGSVTLMPVTGAIQVAPEARAALFDHASEQSSPARYSVRLQRYGERVEMTGGTRVGMLRVTTSAGSVPSILVEPNSRPGEGFVEVRAAQQEIVGYNPAHRIYQGAGKLAGFSGYFVVEFQQPFAHHGTWCGTAIAAGQSVQNGHCPRLGAYATFASDAGPLIARIGTSFTSMEEARRNLQAEQTGWDFDALAAKTQAAWEKALGRIEIEGATAEQRRVFYTALYHSEVSPRITSDADGTYNGFAEDGKLHHLSSGDYYDDYSLWDTFRALHPLFTILEPEREQQMVQSLVLKGQQGGFLPIYPAWNNYTSEMIGDHADAVIADAWAKGLRGFDVPAAFDLMVKNATVTPPPAEYKEGRGRRALTSYLKYGFIPLEDPVADAFHHDEQVSRTLEYAYDDSLIAGMARQLGRPEIAEAMDKRAESWRNVLDPETRFVRGRHADGTWITPFDPAKTATFITEGLPWQYTFFVPQNVPALIAALGGEQAFIAKLDGLFDKKLYDQGNEPSHHIAYLYDYAGAPWKAQQHLRQILEEQYHDGPGCLPGNDDTGQMSAWYVLSAMGFYPVCPGTASYALGSPLFAKVTIHQANGRDFIIQADRQSQANIYIQSRELNGAPMPGFLLNHTDITRGGTLRLVMGPAPATILR
jgi:predicted alpha-1,2-mannosidase